MLGYKSKKIVKNNDIQFLMRMQIADGGWRHINQHEIQKSGVGILCECTLVDTVH